MIGQFPNILFPNAFMFKSVQVYRSRYVVENKIKNLLQKCRALTIL